MRLSVPARYRLGELLGGAAGDALTKAAGDELIAEGIRNPERWASIFIPGRWSGRVFPRESLLRLLDSNQRPGG